MDDVAGRRSCSTNNCDLILPSLLSSPPSHSQQLQQENQPSVSLSMPDRLVANEQNDVGSPADGVAGETQQRMIGPQPQPPPPPSQHHRSHPQQCVQERESKQLEQEDTVYQRHHQQQEQLQQPPAQTLKLWNDVAENLAKHQTVIWVKAVDSLESARLYLKEHPALPTPSAAFVGGVDPSTATVKGANSPIIFKDNNTNNPARLFIDKYMLQIISILLEQAPLRIGQMEKECVDKSLRIALQIVKDDLENVNHHCDDQTKGDLMKLNYSFERNGQGGGGEGQQKQQQPQTESVVEDGDVDNGGDSANARSGGSNDASHSFTCYNTISCPTIITLSHIFHKKKVYYKAQTRQWHNGPSVGGLPEVRTHMISVFRRIHGLTALGTYMEMRVGCVESFPDMDWCKDILLAVYDSLPTGSDYGMVGGGGNNNSSSSMSSSLPLVARGSNGQDANPNPADLQLSRRRHNLCESKVIAGAIMTHLLLLDEITLKKMDTGTIQGIRKQLYSIYSRICDADGSSCPPTISNNDAVGSAGEPDSSLSDTGVVGGPKVLHEFFTFWRALALKLITSQSLPLKLFGWDEIGFLILESEKLAPPPRAYRVIGAGTPFVNGLYEFDKQRLGINGYVKSGLELQYHRIIPLPGDEVGDNGAGGDNPISVTPSDADGAGKTLTLFRCTMRSSHKWWFISEADVDQPGTDKDIDYYQHKSKKEEESLPSHSGWFTCRAGADPPPTLEPVGKLVPPGEECNTLERLLAKWAIENGVIELVLGDGIHREVVSRSAGLIKFLAGMCSDNGQQDFANTATNDDDSTSKHCLNASHLLLAWKTCTNKADAAVSAQIYHLLVGILPSLTSSLAIPLIEAAFASLDQKGISPSTSVGVEKCDQFFEVSEFCGAIAERMLASAAPDRDHVTNKQDPSHHTKTADPVREAILNLQWAVLSHKDVLTLKSYESIKKFVSLEICKQDAITDKLRNTFLQHTCYEIKKNEMITDPNVLDETHSLHMVQLAQFLLEGYGQVGIEAIICPSPEKLDHHLPTLMFRDLMSYMKRRSRVGCAMPPLRKPSSTITMPEFNHGKSLSTRLQFLRFIYGQNHDQYKRPENELSCQQLQQLWNVCVQPNDREAVMMFLANASKIDDGTYNHFYERNFDSTRPGNHVRNLSTLSPCFSDNEYIFEKLFCADVGGPGWENLGELAYQSFQSFDAKESRTSPLTTDALWRICLTAGNDTVASRAMNDLLAVYYTGSSVKAESEGGENSQFSHRIFNYLVQVKEGLKVGNRSSERSAERCIRILSAAIEKCNSLGASAGAVAERFDALIQKQHDGSSRATVEEFLILVPHGMRGVYSCNTVSIIARTTARGNGNSNQNNCSTSIDVVGGDGVGTQSNRPERFLLEIHPLQTLASIKHQIAAHCNHDEKRMKLNNLSGQKRSANGDFDPRLSTLPDATLAADLGIVEGSEIIALLSDKIVANNTTSGDSGRVNNVAVQLPTFGPAKEHSRELIPASTTPAETLSTFDLTGLFSRNGPDGTSNLFFDTLMSVLELLPIKSGAIIDSNGWNKIDQGRKRVDSHSLAWDLLLAMPTNAGTTAKVREACSATPKSTPSGDSMALETVDGATEWSSLLDFRHFERSVYVMQILDSFLRPAHVIFSSLPSDVADELTQSMLGMAMEFRTNFIRSGGFEAVLRLFFLSGKSCDKSMGRRNKMGNECALRIIKECFFANDALSKEGSDMISSLDKEAIRKFLNSLVAITIDDCGVSDNAILRVLKLVRMLLESGGATVTSSFTSLPGNAAETFLTSLLLWKGSGSLAPTSFRSAVNIRKNTEEMILALPLLSASALPWLVRSLENIDPFTDGSDEFFSVLLKLVNSVDHIKNATELRELGTAVCVKVASCPRPKDDTANTDHSTGVLCGCLNLLIALIESSGDNHSCFLAEGSRHIMRTLPIRPWSDEILSESIEQWEDNSLSENDRAIINLMGAIFDGFISTARPSELSPICCDSFSRHIAFNVISAAAQSCGRGAGYRILSQKINCIISDVAPALRHRWGTRASAEDRNATHTSSILYSGLKNQGCTCYMNSVLQQLFMMPALRENLCSAQLPTLLRTSGGGAITKGEDLVGKKISVHWENGSKYDAIVMNYDESTGMHVINYCRIQVATDLGRHNSGPDFGSLPQDLPEEYILTDGRPGKETGVFEIMSNNVDESVEAVGSKFNEKETLSEVNESPDESSSRKLLEEVQRTFVNLEEARGRCFDPRSLVEASHCLKLEFDVWQQNDASEFAMKLLDRLEISLKKWSPAHFRYLAHTFGMKKTTQKICRECGLKTNREEDMMNIDCQIRNKTSIEEALTDMCEDEIMEGDNKVLCETCKIKTKTVLRTAISALPDVLVLSLKRFDLDYTTFETVKLNSRCEFGEALNMKQYTLQAKEILEASGGRSEEDMRSESGSMMDLDETETKDEANEIDPLSELPDEDYEYRLAGVLVHAGVAQGGHYYSFIKDRTSAKWYRFDDEDVTPFDPSLIEQECFGGKVKKETKLSNGQTHTVVSEQFANALMLFYEKVKPVTFASGAEVENRDDGAGNALMEVDSKTMLSNLESSNGFEAFLPGVRKSNSTHSWQAFLLTDEFQAFVKKILNQCVGEKVTKSEEDNMDITPMSSPLPDFPCSEVESWRLGIIRMSLSFVFDILFHLSSKKSAIADWSQSLIQIFSSSWDLTARFVSDLAKRSHQVSENWIRAYTMECPEENTRRAALQIFACAMHSLLSSPTEQNLLKNWTRGWTFQESKIEKRPGHQVQAMPTKLELMEVLPLEDISQLGLTATSIGVVLSFLSELIEVTPRYSQTNNELCFFIRELACAKAPTAGKLLRDAMIESHILTRLICLAIADLSPLCLKYKFPGSSIPLEIAGAISREESQSSLQVGLSNHGGGSAQLLVETVGCLLGMPWMKQEAISYETGEISRGRALRSLTPRAIDALTAVFEESKPLSSHGMTPRDVQIYLQKCGQHVPPQRIEQIFSRHAVDDPSGNRLLTLKGFLAYYRDIMQNSEYQVQKELHAFGFRPDLTRRSDDCRWYLEERSGQNRPCSARESIANEIVLNRTSLSTFPMLTEIGLHSLNFLNFASSINGAVEYLLAAAACGRKSQTLIIESLDFLHRNIGNWVGGHNSDVHALILTVLAMLTAIPDEKQQARITMIMMNDDGNDYHEGLLVKGERLIRGFPNDYRARIHADKYSDVLRVLRKQHAVSMWMSRNRTYCTWIDPEAHPESAHPLQSRSDHPGRRSVEYQNAPNHLQHPHPNAEDESGLDDDSRSDDDDDDDIVQELVVDGCGVSEINGVFQRDGSNDNVSKYIRRSRYKGREQEFTLYRCKLTDRTRRWYISIVPVGKCPGSADDVDFYFAVPSPHGRDEEIPPRSGWSCLTASGGLAPPPQVFPRSMYDDEEDIQLPDGLLMIDSSD